VQCNHRFFVEALRILVQCNSFIPYMTNIQCTTLLKEAVTSPHVHIISLKLCLKVPHNISQMNSPRTLTLACWFQISRRAS
jgi:hypothetical protein